MGSLRSVATMAAVSFLAQGIVWVVFSILAILAYSCNFEPKENMSKNPTFSGMARYYFSDTSCWSGLPDRSKAGITSTYDVVLLASLHFTFNFLICIVSLVLLFVIPRRSNIGFLGWLYSFLFLALAISVTDMVTSATFSTDKDTLSGTPSSELAPLTNMLLLVSLVAAKGFVYWALNVTIVLYIFISATMRLFKACKKMDEEKEARNGHVNAGFEEDERGLPAHTAVSRWPGVGRSLWMHHHRHRHHHGHHGPQVREHWDQESNHRDRSGFGTREELKQRPSFRDAFNYMQPRRIRQWDGEIHREGSPGPSRTLPTTKVQRDRRESDPTRPNSLQEAILTIKPLRQVRPKIPEMQNKY